MYHVAVNLVSGEEKRKSRENTRNLSFSSGYTYLSSMPLCGGGGLGVCVCVQQHVLEDIMEHVISKE